MDIKESLKALRDSQAHLNAVVTFYDEQDVLKQLEAAKDKKLKGLPVVLKDNVSTKGVRTTASSNILDNYVPVFDATIVEKMREAGCVFVAKSSMDELAMGGTGLTCHTGPTKNPYGPERISGGSSSGSAALVGAHLIDCAIGSDTGDSVRKPAAYCGCVGFKPTYGRISRFGIIPYASSLDHVGIFSTSVAKTGTLMEVLQGRDDKDLTTLNIEKESFSNLEIDLNGKTIGVIKELVEMRKNTALSSRFNELLETLKQHGAIIKEISLNRQLLEQLYPVYYIVANCEASANHANLDGIRFGQRVEGQSYQEIMTKTRTAGFGSLLKRRLVIGAYGLDDVHQVEIFRKAQQIRRLIVDDYLRALNEVDVMLTMASDSIAPKVEDVNVVKDHDEMIIENHLVLDNFAGTPSITLPLGFSEGFPYGINLSAKPKDDRKLLDFASEFEKLIDFSSLEGSVNPWLTK